MLDRGINRVHIRKPGSSIEETEKLIQGIPERLHSRLSLHDHHELIERYPCIWPHVNARNPEVPEISGSHFSRSCHSLEELEMKPEAAYSFLSPIFDSISKQGYSSTFRPEILADAAARNIINSRTIALGGVTPERIPMLGKLGFGGAAMLGYLWGDLTEENIKKRIDAAIHYTYK